MKILLKDVHIHLDIGYSDVFQSNEVGNTKGEIIIEIFQ